MLESTDRPFDVTPSQVEKAATVLGERLTERMLDLVRDSRGLLPNCYCLREPTELGEGPGKMTSRENDGNTCHAQALLGEITREQRDIPSVVLHRPTMLA